MKYDNDDDDDRADVIEIVEPGILGQRFLHYLSQLSVSFLQARYHRPQTNSMVQELDSFLFCVGMGFFYRGIEIGNCVRLFTDESRSKHPLLYDPGLAQIHGHHDKQEM